MPDRRLTYKVDIDTTDVAAARRQIDALARGTAGGGAGAAGTGSRMAVNSAEAQALRATQRARSEDLAKFVTYRKRQVAVSKKAFADVQRLANKAADAEIRDRQRAMQAALTYRRRQVSEANKAAAAEIRASEKAAAAATRSAGKNAITVSRVMAGAKNLLYGGGVAGLALYSGKQAATAVANMGAEGAEIARLTNSYGELAAQIGITADTLTTKMRAATQGTVADYNMLSRANLLLVSAQQGALDVTEDQIATLAEFARLRSTQLTQEGKNLSTEEAFSRLIRGVAKRETELLDELGISSKQMADILGISVKEVNSSVQSMLDSVLAVAEMDIANFGKPVEDEATRIERAAADIENSMNRVKTSMAPTAVALKELWANIVTGLVDFAIGDDIEGIRLALETTLKDAMVSALEKAKEQQRLEQERATILANTPKISLGQVMSAGMTGGGWLSADQIDVSPVAAVEDQIKMMEGLLSDIGTIDTAIHMSLPGADDMMADLRDIAKAVEGGTVTEEQIARAAAMRDVVSVWRSDMMLIDAYNKNLSERNAAKLSFFPEDDDFVKMGMAGTQLTNTLDAIDDASGMGVGGLENIQKALVDIGTKAVETGKITKQQILDIANLANMFLSLIPSGMGSMLQGVYGPQFRPTTTENMPTSWGGVEGWLNGEVAPAMVNVTTQWARDNAAAAKASGSAWDKAAADAASAFKSKLDSIPGLPGSGPSPVTQEQLDQAAAGVPQNFADDFTRQMNDELVNGVDWPNVTRSFVEEMVTASTGLAPGIVSGLSNEMLASMATGELGSGAVLGTQFGQQNIDTLVNWDAIAAGIAKATQQEAGVGFFNSQLAAKGIGPGMGGGVSPGGTGTSVASSVNQGVATALGRDGEVDMADVVITGLSDQLGLPANQMRIQDVGKDVANSLFAGFAGEGGILSAPWSLAIANSVKADIVKWLESNAAGM